MIFGSIKNNTSVVGSYLNLTLIQILNSFFYLLIYPFVIKSVGVIDYGKYIYYNSISAYFLILINYGFDIHGAKFVAINKENNNEIKNIFNDIFFIKLIFFLISLVVFLSAYSLLKITDHEKNILLFCFLNTGSSVFLSVWYFHGVQKLHVVTVIQLIFKIISLPIIIFSVVNNVERYALIITVINFFSSLFIFFITIKKINKFKFDLNIERCIKLLKEVQPYFWSTACIALKQRSIELIIGYSMGMRDLAMYDLAYKIFSIPNLLVSNINAAIFPKMVGGSEKLNFKKILFFEIAVGFLMIISIVIFSQTIIEFVFGKSMGDAYLISVVLSFNIIPYLIVGAYMFFIFIPKGEYKFILTNQILSVVVFYGVCGLLYFSSYWNIFYLLCALIISGISEIVFCLLKLTRKHKYD